LAVFRGIAKVVIHSVDFMICGRSKPHIGKKIGKIPPSLTDGNSLGFVVREGDGIV
jgi:hypothetical protein